MSDSEKVSDFQPEIKQMMHAFGDDISPMTTSISFVEQQIFLQMKKLTELCRQNAEKRSSKSIELKDVFAILQLSPISKRKISRLVHSFKFMDLKETYSSVNTSKCEESIKNTKVTHCYKALIFDEQTKQEYCDLFQPEYIDIVTQQRREKIKERASQMNVEEYKNFVQCRSANFRCSKRFKNWIQTDCDISNLALEALQHIAFESVALLVENALNSKNQSIQARNNLFNSNVVLGSTFSTLLGSLKSSNSVTKFIEKRFYAQSLSKLPPEKQVTFYLYL